MAKKKNNTPANNGGDIDELLRMLDTIEKRTLDDDVEDAIRQFGYGNNTPASDYIPPEKGFTPDVTQKDLSQLLISPNEDEEEEGNETLQQLAQLLESSNTEEDMTEDMPPPPEQRQNPFAVVGGFFAANLPRKGDEPLTLARKGGFWVSLVVLLAAIVFLIVNLGIQPQMNANLNEELADLYQPARDTVITDSTEYPMGMLSSFKELYKRNNEVSGWLSFHSTGNTDFLNIEYPVMYSGDNTKYAHVDFDQKKNKNGCLFLDSRNEIRDYDGMDQSTIIYGHNMASGQMFAGLNKFIGNENNARNATTFTFSSLYRRDEYVVFAVCLSEEQEAGGPTYFNYWRTVFDDGDQFLSYIQQVRDRSLFDYPTDVRDNDSIIILASCTGRTSAKLNDGRVLVFARRLRPNETGINTGSIAKNTDVIMPYSWYINQGMDPHIYYRGSSNTVQTTTTTTTTVPSGESTTDTTGTDTTGTDTTGTDTTTGDTTGGTTTTTAPSATTPPESSTTTTKQPPESSTPAPEQPPESSTPVDDSEPPEVSTEEPAPTPETSDTTTPEE